MKNRIKIRIYKRNRFYYEDGEYFVKLTNEKKLRYGRYGCPESKGWTKERELPSAFANIEPFGILGKISSYVEHGMKRSKIDFFPITDEVEMAELKCNLKRDCGGYFIE